MYVDTHAHPNFKEFNNDYEQVIERAFLNDVKKIIVPGSNFETSQKAIKIAEKHPNCYAAVGLHPIHTKEETFNEAEFLKLAQNKKVVAIGETGLDYYHDKKSADLQKEIFQKHINLAKRVNKPLIIHSRDANSDILSILIGQSSEMHGVMHCFSGDWQMAKVILDLGLYLGFTGIITFSKNYANLDVVKVTPLERILIETDSPWLAPEPHRGERNEPAFVVEVAKKIAEIKKISLDEVARQTTQNAIELFKLEL